MDSCYLRANLIGLLVLISLAHLGADSANDTGSYYDPFATTECVEVPAPSLYGGGIIVNPEFDNGTSGWSPFGSSKLEIQSQDNGNKYIIATERKNSFDSVSQNLNLSQGLMYTLAAWLQISGRDSSAAIIKATVAMKSQDSGSTSYNCAGTVIARSGCWSFLKGGFTPDFSPSSASLYFESSNVGVNISLDSVSLKPFTKEEWRLQQEAYVQKNRKGRIMVHAMDRRGRWLKGAKIMINQTRRDFPFGSAIANTILGNEAYQKWFVERFNVATFENELKWYSTEPRQGALNYNDSDALVEFCKSYNISMRGHNIFWEDPRYTPQWVKDLSNPELQNATESRVQSLVSRYKGQFLNWDVSNEMLHFSFFEDRLGPNASLHFFELAQELDPSTPMFMNDYNTLETCSDMQAISDEYLKRLQDIVNLKVMGGIGLESHFGKPNIPLVRSILDKLGSTKLPIWLTELDITNSFGQTKQGEYLEEVLREGFSHGAVDGIVMWSAWHPYGCYRMCLTNNNFNNLPTGDVVDKLIKEWTSTNIGGIIDKKGRFSFLGFAGEYMATISHFNQTRSINFTMKKEFVASASYQPHHIRLVI